MRKFWVTLFSCVFAFTMVACGSASKQDTSETSVQKEAAKEENVPAASNSPRTLGITIQAWMEGKYDFQRIIKEFEEENPGVTVVLNKVDTTDVTSNMLQWSQGKTNCDIAIGSARAKNLPYVLNDYIIEFTEENFFNDGLTRDAFFDAFFEEGSIGGKQYMIPFSCEVYGLVANIPMMEAAGLCENGVPIAPKTWDEVAKYAEQMTIVKDGVTIQEGIGFDWGKNLMTPTYFACLNSLSGTILSDDGVSPDFTSEAATKTFTLWKDLYDKGYTSIATFADGDAARTNFKSGNLAMHVTTASRWVEACELLGKENVTCLPLPGSAENGTMVIVHAIMIPKCSENIDLAIKFIKEKLLQDEFLIDATVQYGKMSPLKAHYENLTEGAWPDVVNFTEKAVTYPVYKDFNQLNETLVMEIQNMITGTQTIEQTQENLSNLKNRLDYSNGMK